MFHRVHYSRGIMIFEKRVEAVVLHVNFRQFTPQILYFCVFLILLLHGFSIWNSTFDFPQLLGDHEILNLDLTFALFSVWFMKSEFHRFLVQMGCALHFFFPRSISFLTQWFLFYCAIFMEDFVAFILHCLSGAENLSWHVLAQYAWVLLSDSSLIVNRDAVPVI